MFRLLLADALSSSARMFSLLDFPRTYDIAEEERVLRRLGLWLDRLQQGMIFSARQWRSILPRLLEGCSDSPEGVMALLRITVQRYPDPESKLFVQGEVMQRFWPAKKDGHWRLHYQALLHACDLGLVYERVSGRERRPTTDYRSSQARAGFAANVRYPTGGVWIKRVVALLAQGEVGWALTLLSVFAERGLLSEPVAWVLDRLCLDAMALALREHRYGTAAALGRWLYKRDADDVITRRFAGEIVDRASRIKAERRDVSSGFSRGPLLEELALRPGGAGLASGVVVGLKAVVLLAEEEARRRNQPIILNLLSWDDEA